MAHSSRQAGAPSRSSCPTRGVLCCWLSGNSTPDNGALLHLCCFCDSLSFSSMPLPTPRRDCHEGSANWLFLFSFSSGCAYHVPVCLTLKEPTERDYRVSRVTVSVERPPALGGGLLWPVSRCSSCWSACPWLVSCGQDTWRCRRESAQCWGVRKGVVGVIRCSGDVRPLAGLEERSRRKIDLEGMTE